eukprot:gene31878-41364_t
MSRRTLTTLLALITAGALALWLTITLAPRRSGEARTPPSASTPQKDQRKLAVPPSVSASSTSTSPAPIAPRVPAALANELARLLALPDPAERSRLLADFWRHWFPLDREGVLAALAGLPLGDDRAQALLYALLALADTDPDRALELAVQLVRDASDAHLFSSLFDLYARAEIE